MPATPCLHSSVVTAATARTRPGDGRWWAYLPACTRPFCFSSQRYDSAGETLAWIDRQWERPAHLFSLVRPGCCWTDRQPRGTITTHKNMASGREGFAHHCRTRKGMAIGQRSLVDRRHQKRAFAQITGGPAASAGTKPDNHTVGCLE